MNTIHYTLNNFIKVCELDSKNLIDDEISEIARDTGLHEDDDRDEILQILAEELEDLEEVSDEGN